MAINRTAYWGQGAGGSPRRGVSRILPAASRKPRAGTPGFALLVAVIFMSVMLTFGLALGSLAYKQQILASSAIQSQYAFYAADAGLECVLYEDQQEAAFSPYPTSNPGVVGTPSISCDGSPIAADTTNWTSSQWTIVYRVPIDTSTSHPRCADVSVYKYSSPLSNGATTYLFSQGYDASCTTVADESSSPTGVRFSARGISAHY